MAAFDTRQVERVQGVQSSDVLGELFLRTHCPCGVEPCHQSCPLALSQSTRVMCVQAAFNQEG